MNFSKSCQPVTIVFELLFQPVPALIPAVSQHNFQLVLSLCQRQLKRLVLYPAVIAAKARKKALISLLFSVEIELIHAQANHVRPCPFHRLIQINGLPDNSLHLLWKIRSDPSPLPLLRRPRNSFGCFKILNGAPGSISCLI